MRRQFSIILTVLLACGAIGVFRDAAKMAGSSPPLNEAIIVSSRAQQKPVTPPPLEGCLKCHDKIEPMHRYGPTVAGALDKLDNGKDGMGLTCTACHGGNPVATTKAEAHVQPRFPKEWERHGKFRGPADTARRR